MRGSPFRLKPFAGVLVAGLLLALAPSPARAGDLSPDLQAQVQSNPLSLRPVRVIVQLKQSGILGSLLAILYRGQLLGELPLINGLVLSVPQTLLPALSLDPLVASVSPDRKVGARWDEDTASLGAEQAWSDPGITGSGVRVAVLDTGLRAAAPDLASTSGASRVVAWKDFVNSRSSPYDDSGHGTHVAGIVAGSGASSQGTFRGTAPNADLVVVKVLDKDCQGSVSGIIKALNWCVQERSRLNLKVVNLSLGHRPGESYRTDPLCRAVRRAVNAGLVVVCAAGNGGKNSAGQTRYGGILSPAIEPSALTVGATNTFETAYRGDDAVASYSSRGPTFLDHLPKPDVVAPGNRIVSLRAPESTVDQRYPDQRVIPGAYGSTSTAPVYSVMSGTSMAAAQVSGVVALMLRANGSLTPNAVKALLMYTAQTLPEKNAQGQPLSPGLSLLTQGAGSVNAAGAVSLAAQVELGAAAGQPWLPQSVTPQTTLAGYTFPWAQSVIWQGSLLSGTDLAGLFQGGWSLSSLWGSTVNWLGSILVRDNGVEAEQGVWGQQLTWSDDPPPPPPGEEPPPPPGEEPPPPGEEPPPPPGEEPPPPPGEEPPPPPPGQEPPPPGQEPPPPPPGQEPPPPPYDPSGDPGYYGNYYTNYNPSESPYPPPTYSYPEAPPD